MRLFTDLLERSYVARIEPVSDERILYPTESVAVANAPVRSKIVTRRHAEIARWTTGCPARRPLAGLRRAGGRGVVRGDARSAFGRIIQQSSYAGLVDKLNDERGPHVK